MMRVRLESLTYAARGCNGPHVSWGFEKKSKWGVWETWS
jgi:hypothetical protein